MLNWLYVENTQNLIEHVFLCGLARAQKIKQG